MRTRITGLGGNPAELTQLIEKFTNAHGKDLEFRSKLVRALHQELLYKHIKKQEEIFGLEEKLKQVEQKSFKKYDLVITGLNKDLANEKLISENLKSQLIGYRTTNTQQGDRIVELTKKLADEQAKTPITDPDHKKLTISNIPP